MNDASSTLPEPVAARIFAEVGGNRQEAINRLTGRLHWEEGEAVAEIRKCLALGVRDGVGQAGSSGTSRG